MQFPFAGCTSFHKASHLIFNIHSSRSRTSYLRRTIFFTSFLYPNCLRDSRYFLPNVRHSVEANNLYSLVGKSKDCEWNIYHSTLSADHKNSSHSTSLFMSLSMWRIVRSVAGIFFYTRQSGNSLQRSCTLYIFLEVLLFLAVGSEYYFAHKCIVHD